MGIDALGGAGLAEAEVGDEDGAPGEELGDGGEVHHPVEDLGGAGADAHVGEEGDGGGDGDAVVGHARGRALEEELRRLLVLGDAEEVARAGEEEGVGRRRGRGEDDGVDDVREHGHAGAVDGDDPGRLGGAGPVREEVFVVRGDEHADGEGAEHVEEEDAPEDAAHGFGDVVPRVVGLARRHGHHLHATVREGRVHQRREQAQEAARVAAANVLLHRAGVFPVAEAEAALLGAGAEVEAQGHDDEADDGDNFYRGEDEFCLAVYGNGEDVEGEDEDDDEGDPGGLVDFVVPVANDHGGCRYLGAQGDG